MLLFAASLSTQSAAATQALPIRHRKRLVVSNTVFLKQIAKGYALEI
jgi:hypothetical protein